MSADLHIANIEREAEVFKNVLYGTLTQMMLMTRDAGHAGIAEKLMRLRDELNSIYPKRIRP